MLRTHVRRRTRPGRLALARAQAVETLRQRIAQCRGDLDIGVGPLGDLESGAGQFLDKERNAVALGQNLLGKFGRQMPSSRKGRKNRLGVPPSQPTEGQCRDVGVLLPWWLEFRPVRNQHHCRPAPQAVEDTLDELDCCRVDPVRVFDHNDERREIGFALRHLSEQVQRRVALLGDTWGCLTGLLRGVSPETSIGPKT